MSLVLSEVTSWIGLSLVLSEAGKPLISRSIFTSSVLADAARYAPGEPPPPHLSPFVDADTADEETHVPDYALELRRLQVGALQPTQAGEKKEIPCCAGPAGVTCTCPHCIP